MRGHYFFENIIIAFLAFCLYVHRARPITHIERLTSASKCRVDVVDEIATKMHENDTETLYFTLSDNYVG